ncbi:MAG: DNA-binding transcriptional regulator [Planctomycetota bacterium]|jgi:LacI family transcriptional regulator
MTLHSIPKVMLLADTSRASGRRLIRGIARYARLHGPWLFNRQPMFNRYQIGSKILKSELDALYQFKEFNADGIIANNVNNKEQFDRLLSMGVPMVIIGDYLPKEPSGQCIRIHSDSEAIGKLAAEHLLGRGYENFAFCGYDFIDWSCNRRDSFSKIIADKGFVTHSYEQPKSPGKRRWENEQYIMSKWLQSLPKPVGVMACNDDRAQQVIDACKIENLHVPEQVSVLGVDDDEFICDLTEPPLSSVVLNNEKAGFEASRLLQKMMKTENVPPQEIIVVPTHIVTRQSTDILAIDDPHVALAIRYIRQHSKELIQVNDVVNIVSLGRRTLEERFNKIIGRTIFNEITRCRINKISQALLESKKSISEIALDFGYTSEAHISRYFKRTLGITPLEYRKQHG